MSGVIDPDAVKPLRCPECGSRPETGGRNDFTVAASDEGWIELECPWCGESFIIDAPLPEDDGTPA